MESAHQGYGRPDRGGTNPGGSRMTIAATLVEALGRGLPGDRLVLDPDVLAAMSHDEAEWAPAEPAPASAPWSTSGGSVATNAGGLCCLRYGVPRDYVLGLRAVVGGPVAYGDAVRLGRRTTKGVAGLDMAGLFVGSEGTLGVVTEVTLRLRPALAGTPRTVAGAFPALVSSGQALAQINRPGVTP